MDITAWIDALDDRITRHPHAVDRAWAWAYVAHLIALDDLLTASSPIPGPACWVEPRMAWALDDLTTAGAHAGTFLVPVVDPADTVIALTVVLDRLIDAASTPDPRASIDQVDACAQTVIRAREALLDYTASTP